MEMRPGSGKGRGGYPRTMNIHEVSDEEWVSQRDAARELNISIWRVAFLLWHGHLEPCENSAKKAGVTRSSLIEEKKWRERSTLDERIWRTLKDSINFL
jgi:hypothetical protein